MSSRDTFYFPHEYNAKDDPKCERLIWEMGMEGYGIFWALLEVLRIQPDYTYPLANIPIVAYKYRADTDKMRRVVLDFDLFTIIEDKIFFSNGLLNRMRPMDEARNIARESGKKGAAKRWKNRDPNRVPIATPIETLIASKVNKSKVKESIKGDYKGESANVESNNAPAPTSADEPRKVAAKRTAFAAPSPENLKTYFSTIGGTEQDADTFFDYFEANGWKVSGKSSMKNWKAAARNWMRRKSEFSNATTKQMNHEAARKYNDL